MIEIPVDELQLAWAQIRPRGCRLSLDQALALPYYAALIHCKALSNRRQIETKPARAGERDLFA